MLAVVLLAAACARTTQLRATAPTASPLDGLGTHLVDAFSGSNTMFYVAAIGGTGVLALSGADHEIHHQFYRHIEATAWNETANIAGYVVPLITAPMI